MNDYVYKETEKAEEIFDLLLLEFLDKIKDVYDGDLSKTLAVIFLGVGVMMREGFPKEYSVAQTILSSNKESLAQIMSRLKSEESM